MKKSIYKVIYMIYLLLHGFIVLYLLVFKNNENLNLLNQNVFDRLFLPIMLFNYIYIISFIFSKKEEKLNKAIGLVCLNALSFELLYLQ